MIGSMRRFAISAAICVGITFPAGLCAQDIGAQDDGGPVTAEELPVIAQPYGPPRQDVQIVRVPSPVAIPGPLDFAAALASATHPSVEAAEAEADALNADYRAARWQRYPSLSVEALAATEGFSFADQDGLALNARLEQPIWSGGRITGKIDRARASLRVGENRIGEARRDIILRVVSS